MDSYIGAKIIQASPISREEFDSRKNHSEREPTNTPGYKVVYEDGYVSWSPAEVFERCYRKIIQTEKMLIN